MLRHALILFAVSALALSAVYIKLPEDKPEEYKDCEGCWVSEIDTFLAINETVSSKTECKEYHCTADYVQVFSCGVVADPCYLNTSRPYPDCCQIICPQTDLSCS